jgi:proline dehydrogenase
VTLDAWETVWNLGYQNVGVVLQSALHRSEADMRRVIAAGARVRLVKGAYKEPPDLAYPRKADVDENFFRLSVAMLEGLGRKSGFRPVFGTHDTGLIARIRAHAERAGLAAQDVEVHMLYGIQRAEQTRLVKEGAVVRVLIAYGVYWFPWYMRRLAERPANVWFVLRSMFAG